MRHCITGSQRRETARGTRCDISRGMAHRRTAYAEVEGDRASSKYAEELRRSRAGQGQAAAIQIGLIFAESQRDDARVRGPSVRGDGHSGRSAQGGTPRAGGEHGPTWRRYVERTPG